MSRAARPELRLFCQMLYDFSLMSCCHQLLTATVYGYFLYFAYTNTLQAEAAAETGKAAQNGNGKKSNGHNGQNGANGNAIGNTNGYSQGASPDSGVSPSWNRSEQGSEYLQPELKEPSFVEPDVVNEELDSGRQSAYMIAIATGSGSRAYRQLAV
jgi:hypothetical protein